MFMCLLITFVGSVLVTWLLPKAFNSEPPYGLAVDIGVGTAVGLPPTSTDVFQQGTLTILGSALLTITLVTPIAFFASAGHGYLPPLGAMILAIFLAQIIVVIGYGDYFPWSIPALYAQGSPIRPISGLIVILTGLIGIAGTFLWWELADQTH